MKDPHNTEISVSYSALEDMIWMSYRYAIGRHTIAAHMHADTIAKYAKCLSQERQVFAASDIRHELAGQFIYNNTIIRHVDSYSDNTDPIYLLLKYFHDNNMKFDGSFWKDKIAEIDLGRQEVHIEDRTEKEQLNEHDRMYGYLTCITDLLIWVKVANYLDTGSHKLKKYKNPETGEIQESMCFDWYGIDSDGTVEHYWNTVDHESTFTQNWHINPEYLIEE